LEERLLKRKTVGHGEFKASSLSFAQGRGYPFPDLPRIQEIRASIELDNAANV